VKGLCDVLEIESLSATRLFHEWLFYIVRAPEDNRGIVWKHFKYGRRGDILIVRNSEGVVGAIIADGRHCERPPNAAKRARPNVETEVEVVYQVDGVTIPISVLLQCLKTRPVLEIPLINRWATSLVLPRSFFAWYFKGVINNVVPSQHSPPPGIRQIVWPNLVSIGKVLGGGIWQWSDSGQTLTARFEKSGAIGNCLVATRQCSLKRGLITATGEQFCDAIESAFVQWVRVKITQASEKTDGGVNFEAIKLDPANQEYMSSIQKAVSRKNGKGLSGVGGVPTPPMCIKCITSPKVEFKNGLRWQLAQIVVDLEQFLSRDARPHIMAAITSALSGSGQSAARILEFTRNVVSFRRKPSTTWPCINRVPGRTDLFCPRITTGTTPTDAIRECVRDQNANIDSIPTNLLSPATIWAYSRRGPC
jgi:hypothetical protein